MSFITRNQLNKFGNYATKSSALKKAMESQRIKNSATEVSVFLSHSHFDKDLVEHTRAFLSTLGVNVFIDWKDKSMPSTTGVETARIIKRKIDSFEKFIMLSSLNSKNSIWVPWELGYADRSKGLGNIAVLPVSESNEQWVGAEYMRMYSKIEIASDGNYAVFAPSASTGPSLKDWLLR